MKLRYIAITALLGVLATTAVQAASIELKPENIKSLVGSGTW
jgi:cytochrome c556